MGQSKHAARRDIGRGRTMNEGEERGGSQSSGWTEAAGTGSKEEEGGRRRKRRRRRRRRRRPGRGGVRKAEQWDGALCPLIGATAP
jgi:hypothetical protein